MEGNVNRPNPNIRKPGATNPGPPKPTGSSKPAPAPTGKSKKESKPPKPPKPPKAKKEKKERSGRGGVILLWILMFLAVGAAGTLGYIKFVVDEDKKKELLKKHEGEISAKDKEINEVNSQLDSMTAVAKQQYEQIKELQGDTTEAFEKLRALQTQVVRYRRLAAAGNPVELAELRRLKSEYTAMLQQQDNELIKLRAITEEQMKHITELKGTVAEKDDVISDQKSTIEDQENTIEKGKILNASEFKVYAINKKGKVKFDDKNKGYKNKDIYKLKIDFKVLPNKIADQNTKTYYIMIKEPSGIGLSGNLAGGTFEDYQGKTLYYASKKDDGYSRTGRDISVVYDKEASYNFKPGKNIIEVYCEGYMIGSGTFLMK